MRPIVSNPAAAVQPAGLAQEIGRAASAVMTVDDVTEGVPPANSVRVRGRLLLPADEAWRRLSASLSLLGSTPVLRRRADGPGEELIALPTTFDRTKAKPVLLPVVLFVLTVLSCLFTGAQMTMSAGPAAINWNLLDGIPYAAALLGILTAHEFGHYLVARRLGSPTSLPYFIPLPLVTFGTLGAVITAGSPIRNRRHLLAIGAAGPLAGLVLAVPILWFGLGMSKVMPVTQGTETLGNSLLLIGMLLARYGQVYPANGMDVFLHPLALAGWAGLLLTGLNLMPVGQLDGGHIAYAALGRKGARIVMWVALGVLAVLTILSLNWILWLVLLVLLGRIQDMPLDDITGLTKGQMVFAAVMGLVFVLTFVPIPFS